MNHKKIALIVFCLVLPIVLLLLSYKIVLAFASLNPAQEQVFAFLEGSELSIEFTEAEASHLDDVKAVMKYAEYALYGLILLLMALLVGYRKDKTLLQKLLRYGGISTVALVLLIALLSFFSFDFMFRLFHNLFFPQGNWMFAANSILIQTFPLDFFMSISRNIFLLALFFGILFIVSGYLHQYVNTRR
jgi:integral membrane protein (TIGR01906 family)